MLLEFDDAKSARNVKERGIGFERFADMDLTRALSRRTRALSTVSGESPCSVRSTSGCMSP
jgi:uncharacterized DUF497 family protein